MKEILITIKFLAAILLILLDLAAFSVGIFCLYGGPDANAFCAEALMGAAAGIGGAAISALLALAIWRFDKRLGLALLILHEIILFLFFALMTVPAVSCREISLIMLQLISLAGLLAGGYGIFKTAKAMAMRRENDK